jgi:hypothetical protein
MTKAVYNLHDMLKKIRVGQRAVALEPLKNLCIEKKDDGTIIVLHNDYARKYVGEPLPLTGMVLQSTWTLEHKQITFKEAVEQIKLGNVVSCNSVHEGRKVSHSYYSLEDTIYLHEAVDGFWFLGEE